MNGWVSKAQSQLSQVHDDDEDLFATNLIDRYAARPVSLQNICLATFVVTYVIQSSTNEEETESDNEEVMQNRENDNSLTKIKLQKGLGVIRMRKQEAILFTRSYINAVRHGEKQEGYRIFLSGLGGTGKSYVVCLIQRHVPLFQIHSRSWWQSTYCPHNFPNRISSIQNWWIYNPFHVSISWLMNQTLCALNGTTEGNWRDMCVLAVGDLYQLPSVGQCPISCPCRLCIPWMILLLMDGRRCSCMN